MARKSVTVPLRDKAKILAIMAVSLGFIYYAGTISVSRNGGPNGAAEAPMIGGLPAGPAEANTLFRARILSDFPLLTPEDSLVQALSRQGFKSDGWFGAKRMTLRRNSRRRCSIMASVLWESDDQARIRTLETRYLRTSGCIDRL